MKKRKRPQTESPEANDVKPVLKKRKIQKEKEKEVWKGKFIQFSEYSECANETWHTFYPATKENVLFFELVDDLFELEDPNNDDFTIYSNQYSYDFVKILVKDFGDTSSREAYRINEKFYTQKDIEMIELYIKYLENPDDSVCENDPKFKRAESKFADLRREFYRLGGGPIPEK